MKKFLINQDLGIISIENMNVMKGRNFYDFNKKFSSMIRLTYGKEGTGQYVLTDSVEFMGEEFSAYFRFENDYLRSCVIRLISGIVKERNEDYPDYAALQKEVDYLLGIYGPEFKGNYLSEYEWKKVWHYTWGMIVLSQEAHSGQVITDFIWM
jgi:hypothetical protein